MRRSVVVAAVLLAIASAFVGGPSLLLSPSTAEVAPAETDDPGIVRPNDGDGGFWPYLNSRQAFEERSPINVVVVGDADEVTRLLREAGDTDWEETDEAHEEADPGTHALDVGNGTDEDGVDAVDEGLELGATEIAWTRTTGATRYAYVHDGDGGQWIEESGQLHDGSYYGQRYHVRLYESPDGDWVAMQTHTEHFDWFTLRHRVDGVEAAQSRLEADLMALPGIEVRDDVSRVYLANDGPSDADGWATVVDLLGLALAPLLVGATMGERASEAVDDRLTETDRRRLAAAADRLETGHLLLVVTAVAVVLGVRIGGIALERHAGFLSMHAIAALLYPIVGVGLPAATYLLAAGLERRLDAAVAASGGLAVAIWLDYGLLGVDSLPIDVVGQRMLVVIALGLIAAGAAKRATRESRWNDMLVAGAATWVLVLGGTLLGYL
ncbi:hypothetical protein [Salinilacihabitans rarus]|uniref:hypothetical protein n=1 Tax=Salinilacihabitans rarus TaxID=2961596 RepID=UPI0020C93103|nr:hypothetical protein [Salinilacihabitans rarus]